MRAPLRVDLNHPHTIIGSRQQARRKARELGCVVWARACGKKAVVFWLEGGRLRQKTYRNPSLYLG